jgi:hypothetical protein
MNEPGLCRRKTDAGALGEYMVPARAACVSMKAFSPFRRDFSRHSIIRFPIPN